MSDPKDITPADREAALYWFNHSELDEIGLDMGDIEKILAAHRLAERAAIVAWLRGEVQTAYTDPQYDIGQNLAEAIESGDHEAGQ